MKERLNVYRVLLNYLLAKRSRGGDKPVPSTDLELCEEYKKVAKIRPSGGYLRVGKRRELEVDKAVKGSISHLRRRAAQERKVLIVTIPANTSDRVRELLGISAWSRDDTIRVVVDESKTILDRKLAKYEDRKRQGLGLAYVDSFDEFNEIASGKKLVARRDRKVIARQIVKGTKPKSLAETVEENRRRHTESV